MFRHELVERGTRPSGPRASSRSAGSRSQPAQLHASSPTSSRCRCSRSLGVVGAFNVIYLINVALAGLRHVPAGAAADRSHRSSRGWPGLMFACAPFLVTRGTAHFSLVAAAPLPMFMYCARSRVGDAPAARRDLRRARCWPGPRSAIRTTRVYCVMLGGVLRRRAAAGRAARYRPAVRQHRAARVCSMSRSSRSSCLIVGVHVIGGGVGAGRPRSSISMRIALHADADPDGARAARARRSAAATHRAAAAAAAGASHAARRDRRGVVAALLLSPTLYAVGSRVVEGRMVSAPVLWRSSAPGVDLLAFFAAQPESSAGAWRSSTGWSPRARAGSRSRSRRCRWWRSSSSGSRGGAPRSGRSRFWLASRSASRLLALGPFVHVAGINTLHPDAVDTAALRAAHRRRAHAGAVRDRRDDGLLRAVRVALAALGAPVPAARGRLMLAVVGLRARRRTAAGAARAVLRRRSRRSTRRSRPIRGPSACSSCPSASATALSSIGDFSAAAQFHQTFHGKRLVGGYLSRVSAQRKELLPAPARA